MPGKDLELSKVASVDGDLVKEAVGFINEKANEMVYKAYEEIGKYLLVNFFGNDPELASSRNPHKPASYRALCEHEGLLIHPSRLGVMVRVAAQERYFLNQKLETDELTYTHKAELVKIPEGPEKLKLVKKLLKKPLTTRQTADEVAKIKSALPRDQKPLVKSLVDKIDSPEKLFEEPDILDLLSREDKLGEELSRLRSKKRKELSSEVTRMLERSQKWVKCYEALKTALDEESGKSD